MRTPTALLLPLVVSATICFHPGPAFSQGLDSIGAPGPSLRRDVLLQGERSAQVLHRVRGPLLGLAVDEAGGVRLIRGLPGAASFSAPVASVRSLDVWAVSSEKGYVLGVSGKAGRLVLLRNLSAVPETVELPIEVGAGARIALSPLGSAAAVLDASAGRLVVLGGLPDHPFPRWRLPADSLPGPVNALAVSDRGGEALAVAGSSLVRVRSTGWDFVAPLAASARLAFVPGRDEAVYLDKAALEAVRIRFTASGALLEPLFGGADGLREPVGIAVSLDGRTVYVADAALPGVLAFDLGSRTLSAVRSPDAPAALTRLRGLRLFQLTARAAGPVYIYDGSRGAPRVAFIPAAVDGGAK